MSRPTRSAREGWRGLWDFRQLLRSLVIRNLTVKYQRSYLGFLWTLLNPLLTVAILSLVFSHIVRIPLRHYSAFLLSGYFVWNFLLQTISAATFMLAEHAPLSRSVAFPKAVPVVASVGSRLVEFLAELALVLIGLAALHHRGVPVGWVWVPWLVLIQAVLALGLVFPLAALSVFYQDVQYVLPILLSLLFYISPVFYPVGLVPPALQPYYLANPVAQLLTLYHTVVYEGAWPAAASMLQLTTASGLILWVGYAIFRRHADTIAEVI